jgi:hypothetical protein
MDLPDELYRIMIHFMSVDDLTEFRIISKDACAHVKEYEGIKTEVICPNQLCGLFQSFPKIKNVSLENCQVHGTDFQQFGQLRFLSTSIKPLETIDIFSSCPNLEELHLTEHILEPNLDLDLVFQHLPRVRRLLIVNVSQITDHALLYVPQLECLSLQGRSMISSSGILNLKHLKKLTIETDSESIQDDAFVGLGLIELTLHNNKHITDQGICHLTKLKRLFCVKCPQIQGVGFTQLTQLKNVGFGQVIIQDVSRFSNMKIFTLRNCQINGNLKCVWKHLEKIRFHASAFEFPLSVILMDAPKLKQIKYECCLQLKEEELRKRFGNIVQNLDPPVKVLQQFVNGLKLRQ